MPSIANRVYEVKGEIVPEATIKHYTLKELNTRFLELTIELEAWSKETAKILRALAPTGASYDYDEFDLVKSVLGKWSIKIITLLYAREQIGFAELRRRLKGISSRVLSQKLKDLEENGLIQRTVLLGRPPNVQYELRTKGRMLAGLGGPVMLFLRRERISEMIG